jgi:hypothetical protein
MGTHLDATGPTQGREEEDDGSDHGEGIIARIGKAEARIEPIPADHPCIR